MNTKFLFYFEIIKFLFVFFNIIFIAPVNPFLSIIFSTFSYLHSYFIITKFDDDLEEAVAVALVGAGVGALAVVGALAGAVVGVGALAGAGALAVAVALAGAVSKSRSKKVRRNK